MTATALRSITTWATPTSTPRHYQAWSVRELDAIYTLTGGAITIKPTSDPGIFDVTLHTSDGCTVTGEWDAADHPELVRLPAIQALRAKTVAILR